MSGTSESKDIIGTHSLVYILIFLVILGGAIGYWRLNSLAEDVNSLKLQFDDLKEVVDPGEFGAQLAEIQNRLLNLEGAINSHDHRFADHGHSLPEHDHINGPTSLNQFENAQTISFETNVSDLNEQNEASLREFIRVHKDSHKLIWIRGFADTVGTSANNRELSSKRAAVVKRFLIRNGIELNRIASDGIGEELAPELTPDNTPEQANRVVKILVSR